MGCPDYIYCKKKVKKRIRIWIITTQTSIVPVLTPRLHLGMHMNLNKMLKNREIITLVPNAAECKNYLNRQHAYLQSLISRLLQIKI